jgi:hypothetical protein
MALLDTKTHDNIEFIEHFLKFKLDPSFLLSFFETNGIDIEAMSLAYLKDLLIDLVKVSVKSK